MALNRSDLLAIAGAGIVAVGVPMWLLAGAQRSSVAVRATPLTLPRTEPLAAIYRRPLFAAVAVETETPADAPELAGIVGRIGQDAVALVRSGDGRTRTVAPGDSVDGWTLKALSIDAASFSRGGQDVRVPLPTGE